MDKRLPVTAAPANRVRESFQDPARGNAAWVTMFSGDITPTAGMSAGLMELPPDGGRLEPHRHQQAEIYFVAAGTGVLSVDGVETTLTTGMAAFIPGDALHALRNEGPGALQVFYVFPTDRFAEVVYRFAEQ